jgi:hypothetical protein
VCNFRNSNQFIHSEAYIRPLSSLGLQNCPVLVIALYIPQHKFFIAHKLFDINQIELTDQFERIPDEKDPQHT